MKFLVYFFFYSYVGLFVLAGIWGAFFGARIDQEMLFHFDIGSLDTTTAASILSQYRFLRIVEFGFGWFALLFTKEIFTIPKYNTLFLSVMFLGVLARIISYFKDGPPTSIFYFFTAYELVGFVFIFLYTRKGFLSHGADKRTITS